MERVECVVIGAGVIGLAIARALALRGTEIIVLESENTVGSHASSRNSEVIHAGIYYPPGSLKARFCVAGKDLLYQYCGDHGISHQHTGKLIVAMSDLQTGELQKYHANAQANGVQDMVWLDEIGIRDYEPEVRGVAALYSPSTGIIDSHAYMQALQGETEANGGTIVCNTPVIGVAKNGDGFVVETGTESRYSIAAKYVVNAAGLGAQQVAAATTAYDPALIPELQLIRGQYYSLTGKSPFSHLIYPVATNDSLGIHVTLDLDGQARFGPDAKCIDKIDYDFDDSRLDMFAAAIRDYYPSLDVSCLQPAYTGIRAALAKPGPWGADFVIHGPAEHGVAGMVCLFGIESPGLTASLAIARHVAELLE